MRKFEIPYNFDKDVVDFIILNNYQNFVEHLYTSPFYEDYITAKHNYSMEGGFSIIKSRPTNREEYEEHLKYIVTNGLKLTILFQNPEHTLTKELLDYYIKLGASSFVVNNDDTAKMIKLFDPNLEVIASITKKLSLNDFYNKDLSNYDKFVLYFPFNRSLESIKKLPKKYKYILLVNCGCAYTCAGTHHWFADGNKMAENGNFICKSSRISESILILPDALELFDDHVYGYKLQGREYLSNTLFNHINAYFNRNASIYEHVKYSCKDYNEHYNMAESDFLNI